jgi:hypothetical protein
LHYVKRVIRNPYTILRASYDPLGIPIKVA